MLIYFNLFGIKIPSYGTMALLGFVLSLAVAACYGKVYGISKRDIIASSCYGGMGLVIGAKLLYAVPFLPELTEIIRENGVCYILDYMGEIVSRMFSGYVFYGGLIGMTAGIYFYTRCRKLPFPGYADVLSIVIPLFHGIGRIGCFLAGCCYGREYHGIFAVTFPENPYEPGIELTERFPVQLLESACNFLLFALLAIYGRKPRRPGKLMGIYLIAYPVIRFITEIFRGDEIRGVIRLGNLELSTSQIISLILLPAGLRLFFGLKKFNQKSQ